MESIKNKIVLITGASSGIGRASAKHFAQLGARLILMARRQERLEALAKELEVETLSIRLDMRDKEAIFEVVETLPEPWRKIDILLNNAGAALSSDKVQDADIDGWDDMIQTNFRGLLYMTRAVLGGMVARDSGHIINIGSTAGHACYPGGNVYSATKHAVRALSESLRIDLLGKAIRVTEIDPGCVETEFSEVRWKDKEKAKRFYSDFTPLTPEDIADAIVYCATRPLHVNISEMIIYPTDQASPNHIYKRGKSSTNMFD